MLIIVHGYIPHHLLLFISVFLIKLQVEFCVKETLRNDRSDKTREQHTGEVLFLTRLAHGFFLSSPGKKKIVKNHKQLEEELKEKKNNFSLLISFKCFLNKRKARKDREGISIFLGKCFCIALQLFIRFSRARESRDRFCCKHFHLAKKIFENLSASFEHLTA